MLSRIAIVKIVGNYRINMNWEEEPLAESCLNGETHSMKKIYKNNGPFLLILTIKECLVSPNKTNLLKKTLEF